jgi:hypothetical protein
VAKLWCHEHIITSTLFISQSIKTIVSNLFSQFKINALIGFL